MKVSLGSTRRTKIPRDRTDYIVLGVITRCNSEFYDTPIVVRNEYDLLNYFDSESSEYAELKALVSTGVTLLVLNKFTDEKRFHSWLTPVKDNVVIPSYQDDSQKLHTLKSPIYFNGETYIVRIYYDPNQQVVGDGFYINLPSGLYLRGIDSEFVSSVSFHRGIFPEYADYYNDVFDGIVGNSDLTQPDSLGDLFDEIQQYFIKDLPPTAERYSEYITPYLSHDAVNDKENGVFTVYYNRPVRYLPKSIHPDNLRISYDYFDNIEFLQNHIPNGTVTFHSKLLGDSSELKIKHKEGLLTITLGDAYEEFEVSGNRDSGKFIGDVVSKLVDISINSEPNEDIVIPDFDENFHPVVDLSSAQIDLNESISKMLESDYNINAIVISDSLIDFDLSQIDIGLVDREFLFVSRNTDLDQLKLDYPNVIKFSGTVDGLPTYIQFVNLLYSNVFGDVLDGVPKLPEGLDMGTYDVWHPESEDFYTYLDQYEIGSFVHSLDLSIDKITVYHLFYIMALSNFIIRYKSRLLFVTAQNTVGKLRQLLNLFSSRFSIFASIDIESYSIEKNNVSVVLSTRLNSILKYKEVFLNFKLEF